MMKVAVFAPDLSGGGGTRVYLIAKVLQKLDLEVTVYGFLFGEKIYPVPPDNLTIKWAKGCNYPQMLGSIRQLLSQVDADILYAIKPRPASFGMGLLKRWGTGKPLLLDIDDWEMSWFGGEKWQYRPTPKQLARDILKTNGSLRNPENPLYLKWIENLTGKADLITADTRFLQQRYGGIYLPNGKDTDLFDPDLYNPEISRQQYNLNHYRVLMFPGTARPHKGLEDVLLALDKLNEKDLRLVLVGGREIGDGYVESLLQRWPQWIIKLPAIPLDKMPEVVSAAHVVVVPQRENVTAGAQFPIKLTDGMAMAKPIIATAVGDIPDVLGDVGIIVKPNSPEEIAAKIRWIFEHWDTATSMARQSRKRCIEYYSTAKMAKILGNAIAQFI